MSEQTESAAEELNRLWHSEDAPPEPINPDFAAAAYRHWPAIRTALVRLEWVEKNVVAWIDNHEYVAAYPSLSVCLEDQVQGGRAKLEDERKGAVELRDEAAIAWQLRAERLDAALRQIDGLAEAGIPAATQWMHDASDLIRIQQVARKALRD